MGSTSKFWLAFFLLFSTWGLLGLSQDIQGFNDQSLESTLGQSLSGILDEVKNGTVLRGVDIQVGDVTSSMPCVQKLIPCEPYLHSPSPPATCCLPLKQMIMGDPQCLCAVFNNPAILKPLNLTQDNALALPKVCGANADISICHNATSPSTSPATQPPTSDADNGSSSGNISNNSSDSPSAAAAISQGGRYGFIASLIALIVSLF